VAHPNRLGVPYESVPAVIKDSLQNFYPARPAFPGCAPQIKERKNEFASLCRHFAAFIHLLDEVAGCSMKEAKKEQPSW